MKKTLLSLIAIFLLGFTIFSQNPIFEWAVSTEGTSQDITVDTNGNVYTTGAFSGTVDFDPGTGISNLISNGAFDVFIQKLDASGNFLWVKQMGGTSSDSGQNITLDTSGNIYTTGIFQGTADFDPGAGTSNLTSNGVDDVFIQKLDASGDLLWVKQMGGTSNDLVRSIIVDTGGNIYTTGYFAGTVDFDPSSGTSNLTSNGFTDIYIQKLNASGDLLWAKQMGGSVSDSGYSIAIDTNGNVYTTGSFGGTVDFDPGSGINNLTSNGFTDIFIQKLDSSGNLLWTKQMGGPVKALGFSITIDINGNIYTTGAFRGTADFDPGTGTSNLTSNGGDDIVIQKLDASGNFLWVKQMGGTGTDSGQSITVDASGNVYTTGVFQGIVDFDPGTGTNNFTSNGFEDIFIQKLDASGDLLWVKQVGGTSFDYVRSIIVDTGGNIYTTGYFKGTVDFDPGSGTSNLTTNGGLDIFIQKLSQPTLGLDEMPIMSLISIYPNPSKGQINISFGKLNNVSINIYDIQGKLVYTKQNISSRQQQINLIESSGVYFITVSFQNQYKQFKFVIK